MLQLNQCKVDKFLLPSTCWLATYTNTHALAGLANVRHGHRCESMLQNLSSALFRRPNNSGFHLANCESTIKTNNSNISKQRGMFDSFYLFFLAFASVLPRSCAYGAWLENVMCRETGNRTGIVDGKLQHSRWNERNGMSRAQEKPNGGKKKIQEMSKLAVDLLGDLSTEENITRASFHTKHKPNARRVTMARHTNAHTAYWPTVAGHKLDSTRNTIGTIFVISIAVGRWLCQEGGFRLLRPSIDTP